MTAGSGGSAGSGATSRSGSSAGRGAAAGSGTSRVVPGQPLVPGEVRWQVHATSIAQTVQELARIWGSVAQRTVSEEVAPSVRAGRWADRRIARHLTEPAVDGNTPDDDPRTPPASLRVRARTSVLTLIVVAVAEEIRARATSTVGALAARHPSRAILLAPGDPDGPASFDARIDAACQVPPRGASEICTEEIALRVGGELAQHLASTVAPLIIHDLPAVLWWPDDAPLGSPVFEELAEECDRILVDSGNFRGDGVARMAAMADGVRHGRVVHDIAWMRLELWRELLAGLFDHPLLQPELRRLTSIRVDLARPGSVTRLTRAALFTGWLAAMLEWQVEQPLQLGESGTYTGILRSGRRQIPVEFRPVSATIDGPVRAIGSLVRVDLEATKPGRSMRVRITRQSDHLLATADWNGAQIARRPARLDAFDETPFLAEALDRTGRDTVFALALEQAVRLTAGLIPALPGRAPVTGASVAGTA